MDLSKLDVVSGAEAGFDYQFSHPATGEPLPLWVHILGMDSGIAKRLESDQNKGRVEKIWKRNKFTPGAYTEEDAERHLVEKCAAMTTAWWEILEDKVKVVVFEYKGQKLEFSKENAAMIYSANPWMKEQVWREINDRANFMKG